MPYKHKVPLKDKIIIYKRKKKITKHKKRVCNKTFFKSEVIFREWLDNNIERFEHKPVKLKSNLYYFEGITKKILLVLWFELPEAGLWIQHKKNNKLYDDFISIEYIGCESFLPQKGYFDADRVDKNFKYFKMQEELYINEVYESIISTCNKLFKKDNTLYLLDSDGVISGYIESKKKDIKQSKNTRLFKFDLFKDTV